MEADSAAGFARGAWQVAFEPDILLPEQFAAVFRRAAELGGERRLMLAVLHDALVSYIRCAGARSAIGRQTFADVQAWVASGDRSWLFAFETICEALELDPWYVRRGLRRWHRPLRAAHWPAGLRRGRPRA